MIVGPLQGLNGSNPLGFLASLGLLRIVSRHDTRARVAFATDGTYRASFETSRDLSLSNIVAEDAKGAAGGAWRLTYDKREKKGVKSVADLKAPPDVFERYLDRAVAAWCEGDDDHATYAAAFGTSVAVDGKGNTKPTAFHFTAANQQFLGTIEQIRSSVSEDWVTASLHGPHSRAGQNVRWDPAAERNWALMATNPTDDGTRVDAPLEWLAFRALPLFPTFPVGNRIITTAVFGRGDEMRFVWPLWSILADLATVRSILVLDWSTPARSRASMGIMATCTSRIRRTGQGFGSFAPATVST